jgi:hypothetical protein
MKASPSGTFFTPFASEEYERLKESSKKVQIYVLDKQQLLFRTQTNDSTRTHCTDWKSRSCSDCHVYAENQYPCIHLFAIYTHVCHHAGISLECQVGDRWLMSNSWEHAMKHLWGKCYLFETMKSGLSEMPLLPVSLLHVDVQPPDEMVLLRPTKKMGRRQQKTCF